MWGAGGSGVLVCNLFFICPCEGLCQKMQFLTYYSCALSVNSSIFLFDGRTTWLIFCRDYGRLKLKYVLKTLHSVVFFITVSLFACVKLKYYGAVSSLFFSTPPRKTSNLLYSVTKKSRRQKVCLRFLRN